MAHFQEKSAFSPKYVTKKVCLNSNMAAEYTLVETSLFWFGEFKLGSKVFNIWLISVVFIQNFC